MSCGEQRIQIQLSQFYKFDSLAWPPIEQHWVVISFGTFPHGKVKIEKLPETGLRTRRG